MKNVILFAAIMLVFGSLKKEDSPKCPQRVQAAYYLNGKKVGVDILTAAVYETPVSHTLISGKEVRTDSIAYKIIY
jgi:hypothetical protein